ncbi:toll/interleukin-1 receptor domain-containing protein [Leifsonia sp. NPDC056665]|uniref:toll/interleukin-1 receptor domain-containing protein n=1 Tax=Leifsonia sp. NPDC056665 TaxID=3345901 RepID=UPI00368A9CAA
MKVFISWSGPRSKQLAEALQEWIHNVIQSVECFYSSDDIRAGQRWNTEINTQLASTDFGLLCVTPENISAPWLNFEAGALSKKVDESRVVPITLGFSPSRLEDPLKQFNGVEANQAGMKKLIASIAEAAKTQIDLDLTFDLWWPRLEAEIEAIPDAGDSVALPEPPDPAEQLAEILGIVRGISHEIKAVGHERRVREARLNAINGIVGDDSSLRSLADLNSRIASLRHWSLPGGSVAEAVSKLQEVDIAVRLLREIEEKEERLREASGEPTAAIEDDDDESDPE